jgi:hypothetical protein
MFPYHSLIKETNVKLEHKLEVTSDCEKAVIKRWINTLFQCEDLEGFFERPSYFSCGESFFEVCCFPLSDGKHNFLVKSNDITAIVALQSFYKSEKSLTRGLIYSTGKSININ